MANTDAMATERTTITLVIERREACGSITGQLDSAGRVWRFCSWLGLNSAIQAACDAVTHPGEWEESAQTN